jgi:hypothetical protein
MDGNSTRLAPTAALGLAASVSLGGEAAGADPFTGPASPYYLRQLQ